MRFSFVLSLLGQTFAIASEPEETEAADGDGPYMSLVSDTERAPIGFAAPDPEYFEEEERRRC